MEENIDAIDRAVRLTSKLSCVCFVSTQTSYHPTPLASALSPAEQRGGGGGDSGNNYKTASVDRK